MSFVSDRPSGAFNNNLLGETMYPGASTRDCMQTSFRRCITLDFQAGQYAFSLLGPYRSCLTSGEVSAPK
jgi:hypothetical protein